MLYRFNLDLAIPSDVFDSIPDARKLAFRNEVRALKALSVRINEGLPNEEMTVKASFHKCHHDTGGSCESEQEI